MRSVRVLFSGVNTLPDLLKALRCAHALGDVTHHEFDYAGSGHGHVRLRTRRTNRELEDALSRELPDMMTGIEDETLRGNDHARCN
jgi:hypothetical protein